MSGQPLTVNEIPNWSQQEAPRHGSKASSNLDTDEGAGFSFWGSGRLSQTTTTSLPLSSVSNVNEYTTNLTFSPPFAFAFAKGSRLFKLRYSNLDVCKDAAGSLRCLELTDPTKQESTSIHTFPNCRIPIPHLEQPFMASQRASFRISFLEEQTMQTAQTLFQAKPDYTFDHWSDCVRFQEAILGQQILFIAGVEEIKSKGRGEECISQNIRILKDRVGRHTLIYFANSQRKEKKRYTSVSLDGVDSVDPGKTARKPVLMKLRAINDMLTQLKSLQVQFLEEDDHNRFLTVLQQGMARR